MGAGVIGLLTVLTLHESARKPLRGSSPAVASEAEAHRLVKKLRSRNKQQTAQ